MPLSSAMLCPPAMKTLPSARRPCPAQKRLALLNDVVWKLLMFGSQIVAHLSKLRLWKSCSAQRHHTAI